MDDHDYDDGFTIFSQDLVNTTVLRSGFKISPRLGR